VKVQTMTESLEALQVQSQQDQKERGALSKELERLEKALGVAAVDSHADSVKLSTLDKLSAGTFAASEAQGLMSSQTVQERDALNTEIARLHAQRDHLERNLTSYRHQESSFRNQIAVLQTELNTGPRDAWPAYRAAIGKARQELAEVKGQLRSSAKDVPKLQKELTHKGVQLERLKRSADSELEIRQKLESELEEQKREYHQATESLSEAAQVEEALRDELASVRQQLVELEKREIHGKEMASEMQNEIMILAQQVKTASKAVESLTDTNSNKRSFWGLR
jgi:chromosome segregation ATPase